MTLKYSKKIDEFNNNILVYIFYRLLFVLIPRRENAKYVVAYQCICNMQMQVQFRLALLSKTYALNVWVVPCRPWTTGRRVPVTPPRAHWAPDVRPRPVSPGHGRHWTPVPRPRRLGYSNDRRTCVTQLQQSILSITVAQINIRDVSKYCILMCQNNIFKLLV